MRAIKLSKFNGIMTITTEEPHFIFWTKETNYEAAKEYSKGYWQWLEMPNRIIVGDKFSFQLDCWCRSFIEQTQNLEANP